MEQLKSRIATDGRVLPGNILKVSSFLNHQIDIDLLDAMGEEFARLFSDQKITKIVTIESSGIAVACSAARAFHVPVVFCKKNRSSNVPEDVYSSVIHSYTHGTDNTVIVSKEFISKDDSILIIDDFLANGAALEGLVSMLRQAGATVVGAGIAIEKGFQDGGKRLRKAGLRIESLAIIESMSPETGVVFLN
ncbi:MAG: xanthine phosphoribosyltransferase [Treponema sp.]|nr:xanthine phosphoribosyltransferase [Candidatus Treponema caballi]